MSSISILHRQQVFLRPDPARLILLPFKPATEPHEFNPTDMTRANHIVDLVMAMDLPVAQRLLDDVLADFADRHHDLSAQFEARAVEMAGVTGAHGGLCSVQRQLIGSYFLREYSYESTALLNSSIVPHPDQAGAPPDGLRFLLSLRAVGEGHISSLAFRSGTIATDGAVSVDPPGRLAILPTVTKRVPDVEGDDVEVTFGGSVEIGSRVIFPVTISQSNGIEDARFVLACLVTCRLHRSYHYIPYHSIPSDSSGPGRFEKRLSGQEDYCLSLFTEIDSAPEVELSQQGLDGNGRPGVSDATKS